MKKITLSIGLVISVLSSQAQDTTCTYFNYFNNKRVIEFEYQTSEVLKDTVQDGYYEIHVEYGDVLCLHFDDQKERSRKVITEFFDGSTIEQILKSEDDVYFSPRGTIKVLVSKPRVTSLQLKNIIFNKK